MFICKKCGNIYTNKVSVCSLCNESDFLETSVYDLTKYKCESCGSIFHFEVTECNNCGSKEITRFNDGRRIYHTPYKYNVDANQLGYGIIDKSSNETMSNIVKKLLILIFVVTFFIVSVMGYIETENSFSPAIGIFGVALFAFCYFTTKSSDNSYTTIEYYDEVKKKHIHKEKNPAKTFKKITAVILLIMFIYVLTTIRKRGYTIILNAIVLSVILYMPIIFSRFSFSLKKKKIYTIVNNLQKNGILYTNMPYEAVPDQNNRFFIQVHFSNGFNGEERMVTSKRSFVKSDLRNFANLLIDNQDISNYYIYF